MITDSYSKMVSEVGMPSMLGGSNEFRRQQEENDRDRALSMFRSDSAAPTVEGSLRAFGGIAADFGCLSEEELRSDPAYIAYYYSNVNLNPRLPPPLLSKEDWQFAQRLQGAGGTNAAANGSSMALGGIGDKRKFNRGDKGADDKSLFSMQLGFGGEDGDIGIEDGKEWPRDGLIGLRGLGLGSQQKSVAEMIQVQEKWKNTIRCLKYWFWFVMSTMAVDIYYLICCACLVILKQYSCLQRLLNAFC